MSIKTTGTYRARTLRKMKMKNTAELIRYAIKNGLVICPSLWCRGELARDVRPYLFPAACLNKLKKLAVVISAISSSGTPRSAAICSAT